MGTASARSIDGFHLHDVLNDCGQWLENFGGHAGAAGLTIKEENIDPFRRLINEVAQKILLPAKLIPSLSIDCELPLAALNMELVEQINALEPYGEGNPPPVFCAKALTVKSHPNIMAKDTIKFWISDGPSVISAVGFGMAKFKEMIKPGQKIDAAYQLTVDDYNKEPVLQLKLVDIRESVNA